MGAVEADVWVLLIRLLKAFLFSPARPPVYKNTLFTEALFPQRSGSP